MRNLLFILTLFAGASAFGQQLGHNFVNYTVDQGLPSNNVHQAIQDSKGYLWFGTDHGLVKFNGHEWEVFTTNNGLTSNNVLFLDESADGRLWIYCDDGRLTYFDHRRFTEFKYNKSILDNVNSTAIPLFLDARGDLPAMGYSCKPGRTNMRGSKISKETVDRRMQTGIYIENFGGELNVHLKKSLNTANLPIFYIEEGDTSISFVTVNNNPFEGKPQAVKIGKTIYFSYKNQLYTYKKGQSKAELIANFPDGILALEKDNHRNLYVGLEKRGLYKLEDAKASRAVEFIPDISVTSIFIDRNDGLWISSEFHGIFFSQESKNLHYTSGEKGAFLHISGNDKRIVTIDNGNRLQEVASDKLIILDQGYTREIRSVDIDEDGTIRLGSSGKEGRIVYDENMRRQSYQHYGFDKLLKQNDSYWCVHNGGLFRLSRDLKDTIGQNIDHKFPINSLTLAGEDTILVGSKGGAYVLIDNKLVPYRHDISFYRGDIVSILKAGELMIICSATQGVRVEKNHELVAEMNKNDGLISETIKDAQILGDRLVILSNRGVSVLEVGRGIRNFSRTNGLISNAVNDVFYRNDTLWLATNQGISIVSLNDEKEFDVNVYQSSFEVNGEEWSLEEHYYFSPDVNTIEIHYEAPVYNHEAKANFRYRLKGVDPDWVITANRSARYSSLPSGKFEFEIAIQNSNGAWGDPHTLLTIDKEVPFWEKASFFVFLGIGLIGGTSLIIYLLFRRKNRRLERAFEVMDLERRAVQAQMNPHFIFNALTSLQNLILEQKKEDAVDFLVKFSRTTRMILNQSAEAYVPLDKELSLLKGYIELEQVRVDNKFKYIVDTDFDATDVLVPPMLIQPFCENAIKHGLNPLESEGELLVKLSIRTDDSLLCIVRDNGVGRGVVTTAHKSKGITLVKERIRLLMDVDPIQIVDLKNDKGEALGTEVRIIIPTKSAHE